MNLMMAQHLYAQASRGKVLDLRPLVSPSISWFLTQSGKRHAVAF